LVDDAVRDLDEALRKMSWRVSDEDFALVGFEGAPAREDLDLVASAATCQIVREGGETTLLVPEDSVATVLARYPGARVERGLRWIRFEVVMAWELTGFLALVTGALARAGIPLGAVCGFSRDHLFVSRSHAARAEEVLERLFGVPKS
jgi:hypothetical protein